MLDTSLGHGRCPLDTSASKSILLSEATLCKCKHLLSLVGLQPPFATRQGPSPCIPRRHSVLHPATQKNGIALIPLFVWFRSPDTALVSPSATQAAHEIIGNVEIFIGDFVLPAAFIRSADSLHGAWQIAHCFGYCLAHDGLQRIGIRKTDGTCSFFCQRFHDGGCIGARTAP